MKSNGLKKIKDSSSFKNNLSSGLKILSIGLDKSIADKNSSVSKRTIEYGNLVDKYHVLVIGDKDIEIDLSDNVKIFSVKTVNKFKNFFDLRKRAIKLIKQNIYNLITVQDVYFLGLISLKLAKQFNLGLEIQVHGFEKFKGLRKSIAKYVIKKADSIRAVSQRLKRQLIDGFKVREDKITVVPIYTEVESLKLKVESKKNEKNNNKFIFLTIGRLVPVKNTEMQIKAIANLKNKFKNIELWIIGEGIERDNLKLKIENLKLEENVKLLGQKDNLINFYNSADSFLLTSDQEGYGMVVIEAAAHGLPIIMTDVGCAREFIINGQNGIIIPVKNQEVLENAMSELIQNKDLRLKLGNNAKESIKNLLTKQETLDLYKESWEKALRK